MERKDKITQRKKHSHKHTQPHRVKNKGKHTVRRTSTKGGTNHTEGKHTHIRT